MKHDQTFWIVDSNDDKLRMTLAELKETIIFIVGHYNRTDECGSRSLVVVNKVVTPAAREQTSACPCRACCRAAAVFVCIILDALLTASSRCTQHEITAKVRNHCAMPRKFINIASVFCICYRYSRISNIATLRM